MQDKLTEDQLHSFLKDEYIFLQGQYEDYDKRSLTIKGWVSTGAVTALALALNNPSVAILISSDRGYCCYRYLVFGGALEVISVHLLIE